jgi:hypothetical protein
MRIKIIFLNSRIWLIFAARTVLALSKLKSCLEDYNIIRKREHFP